MIKDIDKRFMLSLFASAILGTALGFVIWCVSWYADSYAQFSGAMQ